MPTYQGPPRDINTLEPIIRKTCSQCHRVPPPEALPKRAWRDVLNLMFDFANRDLLQQLDRPIKDVSFEEVLKYFTTLAPDDLNAPPWGPGMPSSSIRLEHVRSLGGTLQGMFPGTSCVRLVKLFEDVASPQLVISDMLSGWIMWTDPRDPNMGLQKIVRLSNPAHVEAVDLDRDGRMDLIVADLGTAVATDEKVGSVVWLRRTGKRSFDVIPIATGLGRVADAQAADFDGDGDLDIVVAEFGAYGVGRVLYLENRSTPGKPRFVPVTLFEVPGTISTPIVDLNKDGKPDFAALIAQYQESVAAFVNRGSGQFDSYVLWAAPHPVWGFSGIFPVDLNGDGKIDFVVTNGDTIDDGIHFKPYQGVGWLENKGQFQFEYHRIAPYYGAYAVKAADVDGDGDLDLIVTSFLPGADEANQRQMGVPGMVWYEQTTPGVFVAHPFPDDSCYHPTLEVGDFDDDGNLEAITGTIWLRPNPFSLRSSSVDIWRMRRTAPQPAAPAKKSVRKGTAR